MQRRQLLSLGGGLALGGCLPAGAVPAAGQPRRPGGRLLSTVDFGAIGDGKADDTDALQRAFDAAFQPEAAGMLYIPPGDYRVSRTLRITPSGHITRNHGIAAHGARLISAIEDGGNVIEFVSRSTVRFTLIDGLEIRGSGRDGHGLLIDCEVFGKYIYNFCLRDVVVQNCGGDGCYMIGNVFEGQMINCYFRDNRGNGASFSHGRKGILSAIHAFGCVFGQNGKHGVELSKCYDLSFNGCYFLLNQRFGLVAKDGCTLLSHCGFENNQQGASDFAAGDAGIYIKSFGTMIGCTAYSIYKQTHLVRSYITTQLVLIGCTGSGGGKAKAAALAKLNGDREKARITLIGCTGGIETEQDFDAFEISGQESGVRFGADWRSRNLPQLGEYRLWVDRRGRLRIKKGRPHADEDGTPVGG